MRWFTRALELMDGKNVGDGDEVVEYDTSIPKAQKHLIVSNRSAAYSNLQKYKEALKDAMEAIRLKPDFVKGYARKGLALYYMGAFKE